LIFGNAKDWLMVKSCALGGMKIGIGKGEYQKCGDKKKIG
jgi:hypothetical protein